MLSDGRDLFVYADRNGEIPVYSCEAGRPTGARSERQRPVRGPGLRGVKSRGGIVASTAPLEITGAGRDLAGREPGLLLVVRQGDIRAHTGRPPAGALKP